MDIITLAMAKAYSDSKGGYTENSRTFELTPYGGADNHLVMSYASTQKELNLVEGKTYQVILNGVTYESVCHKRTVSDISGIEVLMIGKLIPDESEPFNIYEYESYGTGITTINGETSITVSGVDVIHRIDNKYLVNEVSLNGFVNTEGVSLADVYEQLLMASMQSGGALQSTEVTMSRSAFRDNCGSENQLLLKIVANGGTEDFIIPVAVDRLSKSGKAIQMSATFMMGFANMGVFEIKTLIWFKSDTTLDFYIKVIPLTV